MKEKNEVGRPTVMTVEVISKLEEAFALGCSDKEACFYAGVSTQSLYNYQEDNPLFIDRKEQLKESPILKARQIVIASLDDPKNAQWYLERKKKIEFAQRTEFTGDEGKDITVKIINYGDTNNPTSQLPTERVPDTPPEGD